MESNLEQILNVRPRRFSPEIARSSSGGLSFADNTGQTARIIKDFLKSLVSAIWGNSIRMPIRVYEPRSFLERITDTWFHFSKYLSQASTEPAPLERFLLVAKALLAGFYRAFISQKQPFNPTLGETASCVLECGLRCFMEQVSHHPPVTQYEAVDPRGRFYCFGRTTVDYRLKMAYVTGSQEGVNNVELNTAAGKVLYRYKCPGIYIDGLVTRNCRFTGELRLEGDGFSLVLHCNPGRRVVERLVAGQGISSNVARRLEQLRDFVCGKVRKEGVAVGLMYGCWLDRVYFEEREIWSLAGENVEVGVGGGKDDPADLPTDSQNRGDVRELRNSWNFERAQREKERIEVKQRYEAKLRSGEN